MASHLLVWLVCWPRASGCARMLRASRLLGPVISFNHCVARPCRAGPHVPGERSREAGGPRSRYYSLGSTVAL